jgi:hypothetical protein
LRHVSGEREYFGEGCWKALSAPDLPLPIGCNPRCGEGDDSMSGQGRVGKEVVLPDQLAEDVHGERWICLPSSLVVSRKTPAKTTRNAGLRMRCVSAFCVPLQHSQHSLFPEEKRRTERLPTSHLALVTNVGSPKLGEPCMATEAHYYPTYGCHGLCRPLGGSRQEGEAVVTLAKPVLFGGKWASGA